MAKTKFEARISGQGRTHEGRRAFTVTSQSESNLHHIVTVYPDRLACDCKASAEFGRVCTHRKLVHDRLVAERAAVVEKIAAAPKVSKLYGAPTPDSPLPANNTRAFSIFK